MTTKPKKKTEEKKPNKSGAEKPVSLWGAPLEDVIKALLQTRSDTKGDSKVRKSPSK